jgi:hypothetical protein
MIEAAKLRKLEIKTADGWVQADMGALEKGDVIRFSEPDGRTVFGPDGVTWELTVAESPFVKIEAIRTISQREGG